MTVWPLKVILTSIRKKATLLCNGELSEKSWPKMKSHARKSRHQQARLQMEKQSYLISKKRQVLQYSACLACILGISSHLFSWITLRRVYPQIRAKHLLKPHHRGNKLLSRSTQVPEKLRVRKKSQKSQKVGLFPPALLPRSSFLCIPSPTYSPAVIGSY